MEFIIGIPWILVTIVLYILIKDQTSRIVIIILMMMGIYLILTKIIKIIKDYLTNVNGEECYGLIIDIYPNGNHINEKNEYNASLMIYIPNSDSTEFIDEVIGFNEYKYTKNTFVKCKYYKKDINIIEEVEEQTIPLEIQDKFTEQKKYIK